MSNESALLLQTLAGFTETNQTLLVDLSAQATKIGALTTRMEALVGDLGKEKEAREQMEKRVAAVELKAAAALFGLALVVVGMVWGPEVALKFGMQAQGLPVGVLPQTGAGS